MIVALLEMARQLAKHCGEWAKPSKEPRGCGWMIFTHALGWHTMKVKNTCPREASVGTRGCAISMGVYLQNVCQRYRFVIVRWWWWCHSFHGAFFELSQADVVVSGHLRPVCVCVDVTQVVRAVRVARGVISWEGGREFLDTHWIAFTDLVKLVGYVWHCGEKRKRSVVFDCDIGHDGMVVGGVDVPAIESEDVNEFVACETQSWFMMCFDGDDGEDEDEDDGFSSETSVESRSMVWSCNNGQMLHWRHCNPFSHGGAWHGVKHESLKLCDRFTTVRSRSTKGDGTIEVANGQDCFGLCWRRRMEDRKLSECNGHKICCQFFNDERVAVGRTHAPNVRRVQQTEQRKTRTERIGPFVWTEHLPTLHVSTRTLCPHSTLHWFVARSRVAEDVRVVLKIFLVLPHVSRCVILLAQHAFLVVFCSIFLNFTYSFWLTLNVDATENPAPIHAALDLTVQVTILTCLSTSWTRSSVEESQIPETEVKFSWLHNQLLWSSTKNSVESLATPCNAPWSDEQISALLTSPRYLPEREASAERSQIYHSEREGFMSRSELPRHRETRRMALTLEKWSRRIFRKRALIFEEVMNRFSETLTQRMLQNLFLKGNRDHLLTQARSELMKQENEVELLNNCMRELQQKAYAQRLDLENTHRELRFEACTRWENRKELKNFVLTTSLYRSWQKVMKHYRDSLSQVQELQERMNYLNDSGKFQEVDSNHRGICSHVPSQPPRIPSPRSLLTCD